jgi:hypothetical protein
MDHDFVALAVFFIRFDCEDGQVGPLGVGADVMLINVIRVFIWLTLLVNFPF